MRTMLSLLIPILLLGAPTLADENPPIISVVGTATTEVAPDEMIWRLRVHNQGLELPAVAEEHHRLMAEVLALLTAAGVAEEDLQTARMTFGENRVYRQGTQYKEGYIASTDVTFTSGDMDSYSDLWIRLSGFEGLAVQGVHYDLADRITIQDETRREALKAARTKAAGLAEVVGATLGEPLRIAEQGTGVPPMPMTRNVAMMAEAGDAGGGPAHAPGRITIRMSIEATFRLIPGGD
jgi:uncharacterized protein YggE